MKPAPITDQQRVDAILRYVDGVARLLDGVLLTTAGASEMRWHAAMLIHAAAHLEAIAEPILSQPYSRGICSRERAASLRELKRALEHLESQLSH